MYSKEFIFASEIFNFVTQVKKKGGGRQIKTKSPGHSFLLARRWLRGVFSVFSKSFPMYTPSVQFWLLLSQKRNNRCEFWVKWNTVLFYVLISRRIVCNFRIVILKFVSALNATLALLFYVINSFFQLL